MKIITLPDREANTDRQADKTMTGTLYLVATPIGNLEDITLRALRILKEVDLIACEDTRRTRKLLSHFGISKPLISYHEHNEDVRGKELTEKLQSGLNVALVSDAGTPLVSDPGYRLVRAAVEANIPIVPIPGPSAVLAALAGSGLPVNQFTFVGFLPSRRSQRRSRLKQLAELESTLVIYEAPQRIARALEDALEILGRRPAALGRELTKIHEEFLRGNLSEILSDIREKPVKGEVVLVIGAARDEEILDNSHGQTEQSIRKRVEEVMRRENLDQKAALKQVAQGLGISRNVAYRLMLEEK